MLKVENPSKSSGACRWEAEESSNPADRAAVLECIVVILLEKNEQLRQQLAAYGYESPIAGF